MNTTSFVSSSPNRFAAVFEEALCTKVLMRNGGRFAECGEVERNGLVWCGEWVKWRQDARRESA